jgi:hypothetical protein
LTEDLAYVFTYDFGWHLVSTTAGIPEFQSTESGKKFAKMFPRPVIAEWLKRQPVPGRYVVTDKFQEKVNVDENRAQR